MNESTTQVRFNRLKWMALGAAFGIILAIGISFMLRIYLGMNCRNEAWVTTRDVDLAKAWFFANPKGDSPIKGTLSAGSRITVIGFKGGVAFVGIDYAFAKKDLETFAKKQKPQPSHRIDFLNNFIIVGEKM